MCIFYHGIVSAQKILGIIYSNVNSEVFCVLKTFIPVFLLQSQVTFMQEDLQSPVGEKTPQPCPFCASLPSVSTCHLASCQWLVCCVQLEAIPGAETLRSCPLSGDVCIQWLHQGYSGRLFGALGSFLLGFRKERILNPCYCGIVPQSAQKLKNLLTFSRLQLLDPLSANKWCQVQLVKSREDLDYASVPCSRKHFFWWSQCLCLCPRLLGGTGNIADLLIAEVKADAKRHLIQCAS